VLQAVGVPTEKIAILAEAPAWYHAGRSGLLKLGPTVLARFGEIHPRVLRQLNASGPVVACEVFVDAVPLQPEAGAAARPPLALSPLQPVERDFAFVVDADVRAETIVRAARSADRALITDVRVFDVFEGGALSAGKKSIAITVVLQPAERTLTDAEIDSLAGRIVEQVKKATGGVLRG
jgi:phenylalanyl-tRNA synthetase beta chain